MTTSRLSILDALAAAKLPPGAPLREGRVPPELARALEPHHFVAGFWHPEDTESAVDTLVASLDPIGLAGFPVERFEAWSTEAEPRFSDEDAMPRHQIGFAVVFANESLARVGDPRRVRCLGTALEWETDEPGWAVLTPEEHAALVAIGGGLGEIERIYDGVERLDAVKSPRPA